MADQTFSGPYVQVAAICTTPLVEPTGNVSVIRIQDRVQLAGPTDQMQPQALNSLWLVLVLKSGSMNGKYTLRIVPVTPSGTPLPTLEFSVLFEGQERGALVSFPLPFVAQEEGLYWFEIRLEDALLTKIPLRVMYQKMQMMPGMAFPPPPHD